jgi:2-polyprenyl-3-methyl-5-hydroxy-6-metoxy-1,4-benzoquinol methylase
MVTSIKDYYQTYWSEGISDWRPSANGISTFEKLFFKPYISAASQILDFGCGDGTHVSEYLTSHGCKYLGVDVSVPAVRACQNKGVEAQVIELERPLPFTDERFDVVTSFEVLEHLFSPGDVVAELKRVLRSGGYMLGSVPNTVYIGDRLLMLLGYFNPGGSPATSLERPWVDPHLRFFSKRSLHAFMSAMGFQSIEITGPAFSLSDLPRLYRLSERTKRRIALVSGWLGPLGTYWPSLFARRLYFAARKS